MLEYNTWATHDVHCHVDLFPKPERIVEEAEKKTIPTIAVSNCPSYYKMARKHLHMMKYVKPALGLHPNQMLSSENELGLFEELAPSCRFIGEIGLDYSKCTLDVRKRQQECLDRVLYALCGSSKFISVHSRKSEDDVIEIFNRHKISRAVFHWYTGSKKTLFTILDAGHFISVNPRMATSRSGRDIIAQTPRERILLESDGPYVRIRNTPVPPWGTVVVINKLSEIWKVDVEEAISICSSNLNALLQKLELIDFFGRVGI